MYEKTIHKAVLIAKFSGDLTIEDIKHMAKDIDGMAKTNNDIFVLSLMGPSAKSPQNMSEILKVFNAMKEATGKITRLYGLKNNNSIVSFLSNVITQILGMKNNTVEASDLESLFVCIEKDAELFPDLKTSVEDWDHIKEEVLNHYKVLK